MKRLHGFSAGIQPIFTLKITGFLRIFPFPGIRQSEPVYGVHYARSADGGRLITANNGYVVLTSKGRTLRASAHLRRRRTVIRRFPEKEKP
jgi:hypothetical protein